MSHRLGVAKKINDKSTIRLLSAHLWLNWYTENLLTWSIEVSFGLIGSDQAQYTKLLIWLFSDYSLHLPSMRQSWSAQQNCKSQAPRTHTNYVQLNTNIDKCKAIEYITKWGHDK